MAHAGGRPPKYKKEFCEQLLKHMAEGLSFGSFAAVIDVWENTLHEWCHSHPEFSDSKKKGREAQKLFYEKLGRSASVGRVPNFNATAFVWMTKNMIGWRDKQEIEHTGEVTIRPYENLTEEEIDKRIRDLETTQSGKTISLRASKLLSS